MDLFDDSDSFFDDSQSSDSFDTNSSDNNDLFDNDDLSNAVGDVDEDTLSDLFSGANTEGEPGKAAKNKKTAIIAIAIGVVGLIAVLCIAGAVNKANAKNKDIPTTANQNINQNTVQQSVQTDIQSNVPVGKPVEDTDGWAQIKGNEAVEFESEYKELTFMVTGIEHYAKKVDAKGNLMIKTTLTGSLSGLTGVYTLDVTYKIGRHLSIGQEFPVKVLMGEYRGRSVVTDILY